MQKVVIRLAGVVGKELRQEMVASAAEYVWLSIDFRTHGNLTESRGNGEGPLPMVVYQAYRFVRTPVSLRRLRH